MKRKAKNKKKLYLLFFVSTDGHKKGKESEN